MPTEDRHAAAWPIVLSVLVSLSGCTDREAWLVGICDQESGFERGTGRLVRYHERIPTDSIMLDAHFAFNGQGPVITWMAERGFARVEVWSRAAKEPLSTQATHVERYSIGPVAANCLPPERIGGPQIAAKLGLDATSCVRYEPHAAPSARYALALYSAEESPTLRDSLIGQRASRQRYALIDRKDGSIVAKVDSGTTYGTRGMFSPRGDGCDRGTEVSAMSQLLRAPSDHRSWWEVVPIY